MCSISICKAYFVWLLTFQVSTPPSSWLFPLSIAGQTVTVLNGPVLAVDKDVGANAAVKYRLLGDRMNFFTVDSETGNAAPPAASGQQFTAAMQSFLLFLVNQGVIRVREGAALDREAFQEPRVELYLVAEDVGGLNSSVPLTVTILDQNDNPPVFSPSTFSVRLPENSPTGGWSNAFATFTERFYGIPAHFQGSVCKIVKEARLKCVLYLGHCHFCP